MPWIAAAQELKTKPTQHSVKELRAMGIQPDILICRSEPAIPQDQRDKIALFCDVDVDAVISAPDVDTVYQIPQTWPSRAWTTSWSGNCIEHGGKRDLTAWNAMLHRMRNPAGRGAYRAGRQVRGVRRLLQEPEGSTAARRRLTTSRPG